MKYVGFFPTLKLFTRKSNALWERLKEKTNDVHSVREQDL